LVKPRKKYRSSREKNEAKLKKKKKNQEEYYPRRRYILTRRTRLGGSYEQTVAGHHSEVLEPDGSVTEAVPKNAIARLKKLHKSEVKSRFYSPKARREHHFETETMQKPEIRKWFEDISIKTVLKEHVEIVYRALLKHIQGRRPEYLMTVILDIVYYTHNEWFEPASFVPNFNPLTYFKNYYFVWDIIREKGLQSLKTPNGIITLKQRTLKSPKK